MNVNDPPVSSVSRPSLPVHNGSLDDSAQAHLNAYLKNVPYACESNQVMLKKLDSILAKLVLCVECRDWKGLTTWIGVLQW